MERMDPVAFKQWLEDRTRVFAVAVFKLLDALPKKNSTRVIASQLAKSASSIGANYREANRAESADDFGHKIQIAMKEASESCYWFEILADLYPMHEVIKRQLAECVELRNLLQSISKSQRSRSRRAKQSNNLSAASRQSNNPNNPTI